MPFEEHGSTAIVVLTPEAEPLAGAVYREHSSAGRDGMTPHVTLVVPFAPAAAISEDIEQRLRRVVGCFRAFDYRLRRFEYFESGVLNLAPEPARPLIDLVAALTADQSGGRAAASDSLPCQSGNARRARARLQVAASHVNPTRLAKVISPGCR